VGRRRIAPLIVVGRGLGRTALGLLRPLSMLACGGLLALGDAPLLSRNTLGLFGRLFMLGGFGEPRTGLDAPLAGIRTPAAHQQEEPERGEQHHDERDDLPSHAAGLPNARDT